MTTIVLALILAGAAGAPEKATAEQPRFALTHVTVVDVVKGSARPEMTVVVEGGRIVSVTKTGKSPKNANIVDATGAFVIPGLWDMHVHVDGEAFDRDANLALFVANGVTGVRVMAGLPVHHVWQREIERGALLGPRMVVGSRVFEGPTTYLSDVVIVRDAAEAREAVLAAHREGAAFIKVHDTVPRDAYFAILKEARRVGLAVEGHVPAAITAEEAAEAGQRSVEHFTGLSEAESDAAKADHVFAALKRHRTWLCPTLIMRRNYTILDDPKTAADWRLKYVEPSTRNYWLRTLKDAEKAPSDEYPKRRETVRKEKLLVGRAQRAGVGILAGTDVANPFCISGFSLHEELAILVDSGLTPAQALQAATSNPAKFYGRFGSEGTVDAGKRADLVVLDANPLADIRNTTKIRAVVVNGHYLNRSALDRILAEVEAAARRDLSRSRALSFGAPRVGSSIRRVAVARSRSASVPQAPLRHRSRLRERYAE
jgi:imidazolonepropionase-like amidohydrolase